MEIFRSTITIVALVASVWAQPNPFDSYMEAETAAKRFMGSVAVVREGAILLKKGYGLANVEHGIPNKPSTKFRIGSLTKQFTATAILQLEEKGKLHVEDKICQRVVACPSAWAPITFHHLLTHTSGIPNHTTFPDYRQTWAMTSRPEQTLNRFRDKALEFTPGDKFSYSNSGYILLAHLVEQISGERWEEYLRRHIFDPASMKDSGHDSHEEILADRATGYSAQEGRWFNAPYRDMSVPIGAGDLYSTIEDLLKWAAALRGVQILSEESKAKMFKPGFGGYGYGWTIGRPRGHMRIGHNGSIVGFTSTFARFPETKSAVVVLSNTEFAVTAQIASELTRLLFKEN